MYTAARVKHVTSQPKTGFLSHNLEALLLWPMRPYMCCNPHSMLISNPMSCSFPLLTILQLTSTPLALYPHSPQTPNMQLPQCLCTVGNALPIVIYLVRMLVLGLCWNATLSECLPWALCIFSHWNVILMMTIMTANAFTGVSMCQTLVRYFIYILSHNCHHLMK